MKIKLFTIPNLLTLSNLFCGSAAVVSALVWGDLKLAFGLMVLAAVFDFFDGFAARLLNQSSPIGLQLDSLADDISFGLARRRSCIRSINGCPASGCPKVSGAGRFRLYGLRRVAAGEIQYRRHAAHGVLRTAQPGGGDALRFAGAVVRDQRTGASARGDFGHCRGRGTADDLEFEDVRPQIPTASAGKGTNCATDSSSRPS